LISLFACDDAVSDEFGHHRMDGKNILDLPDDILFVVLLFVAYVPRDILTCYQVCKTFQSFLNSVDGIFWRRAFIAAFKPFKHGLPEDDHFPIFLWKKGTYRDPLRSFLASKKGRGARFIKPTPVPAFPGCLLPYFLRGSAREADEEDVTVFESLKLSDTAGCEWRPLYKDLSILLLASSFNDSFSGGNNYIFLKDFRLLFRTLSALPGPFEWLRSATLPVSVDLLTSHLTDILSSLPIPEILRSQYEVVPVSNKRDFSYFLFPSISISFGVVRSNDPSRPYRTLISSPDWSDEDEPHGRGTRKKDVYINFDVGPGGCEDSFALNVIPDEAATELGFLQAGFLEGRISKLYDLFVQRLGSCFCIRPRADCEYETFLVNALPFLFVSARPESGRLIGLYSCYSNVY
jgi:hypothetical protein